MKNAEGAKPVCEVEYLGLVDYQQAWEYQEQLAAEIGRGLRPPRLLLLEHPPTYTFGRRGKTKNLLWGESELAQRGIQVHWVDRGGDVTYHGPGQLVGYPLLPLGQADTQHHDATPKVDYIGYLRSLETVLVQALAELGVRAFTTDGLTGVWVDQPLEGQTRVLEQAKIAAIGIKVDARGVSRHGFALNVNPDMAHWEGIIACGLENARVTSLESLAGQPVSMESVRSAVTTAFGSVFGFRLEWV